ncbi:hypothetical protein C805_03762 [Eubacterium sp. 14-2]|uniref:AmmeMemoRadiSam system radical SAM enzyme n=1 Tax=Eubacterium sp. 14-2 TaxID=1235790 RepID=UPI00033DD184|nr:AmmeMemoRadiSam system radical SAM enzyme [Eubacterium sp. 14-2]EOT21683.1 hypothetical protein C805_03762 [Eubacterium sp. 14-2]
MKEAVCQVCIHGCRLKPGQWGMCGARKNENGKIVCGNYGQITSLALDPIEKKPLKMFHPGAMILSVGSFGCNLRCPFCQNHRISMAGAGEAETVFLSPQALVKRAKSCQREGNLGLAFTYNEPLVGWEYVRDAARLSRAAGMKNVLVTNGTASPDVLQELLLFMDAMNIDLKSFRRETYRKLGGDLDTVQQFILQAAASCHVELTTLIVPGQNDSVAEMEEEARWIASADRKIPLHVTRFFPRYQMSDRRAVSEQQIYRLAEAAGKYLDHVFTGNCQRV